MRLQDKVAIISGSARGIGKAIALRFAREGALLTVCDILDCEPVAGEIRAMGGKALVLKNDLRNEADITAMARKTADRYGRIDILVNNAAVNGSIEVKDFIKTAELIEGKDWDLFMEVNLKGTFLCCKAVFPYMQKQGKGKIVNLASIASFTGEPHALHYSTTKGGILTMTRGLAKAWGQYNIYVNAVAPGLVMTESMQASFTPDKANQVVIKAQIIKRSTQPEDIANAILFLASDEADAITGQTLAVNAGEYMH
jgi:NAD(P)-dependent dehydrogenase (short-subunit alcohol dehydrogenase family)